MESKVKHHIAITVSYSHIRVILSIAHKGWKRIVWHVKCAFLYSTVNDMFSIILNTFHESLPKFDNNIKISSYFSDLILDYSGYKLLS